MLTFFKHGNINAKTHCNISDKPFVNLLNTLYLESCHEDQNSEGNKTVNTEVSEDSVATDNEIDGFTKLGLLRKMHIKNLFFGHLNINSLKDKREFLEPLVRNHFDIFLISETKLDFSFSGSELTIPGYGLFRKDRNQRSVTRIFLGQGCFLGIRALR